MQIYKYTTSKEIIENAFRNSGTQGDIPLADAIYWIYECLDLIGYPLQYQPKVTGWASNDRYDFTNWRVPLPCDLHLIAPAGIAVDGMPAVPTTDSFHYLMEGLCCGLDQTFNSTSIFTDNFGNMFDPNLGANPSSINNITYSINNDWITFNKQEGKACIAYWAFPVDDENFPLVPDEVKIKRALSDYLIYKMDYIAFRGNQISKDVYKESEKQYFWSIAAAKSGIKIPDVDQMTIMKNAVIRLLPNHTSESKFFANLGSRERYSSR